METVINKFLGKVSEVGNALMITVPKRNAEYEGLEKGDLVWVIIKKAEDKGSEIAKKIIAKVQKEEEEAKAKKEGE